MKIFKDKLKTANKVKKRREKVKRLTQKATKNQKCVKIGVEKIILQ